MLVELENTLKNNGLDITKRLCDIKHSCCSGITDVFIDFDTVKDEFSKRIGSSGYPLKSVDAIKIMNNKDIVLFVEMKRYTPTGTMNTNQFIEQHFLNKNIPNKFIDSIFILLAIAGYYKTDPNFYGFFLNPDKLKINTVLLVDFNPVDYTALTIASLHLQNISLTKRITSPTVILNCSAFSSYLNTLSP